MSSPRSIGNASYIVTILTETLASRLRLAPEELDPRERFSRYGLDSAGALELVAQLAARLDRRLPATLLWDHPTIDGVAEHLAREEGAASRTEAAQPPAPGGAAGDEPVAIVGLGCRFPGARDPEAFWRLLRDGVDAIREVPAERWDIDAAFDPDPRAPGKMSTRWGGFLERIDGFDAAFFGISPREALEMDPQQRLMLQVAWEALEDAGQPPSELKGSATGVFFGALWNDYATLAHRQRREITNYSATGSHHSIIANRLSYLLGLQGPSMVIDTACSSSLVALHVACLSLRAGESTLALAGGVTLIAAPESTIAMSKLGAMSPAGRSRAFDAAASGYVRGEGAGVVVLKRLADAIAHGDRIYAVVRGSAVNNDGYSNGLTAPNPEAQERVLRDAYRRAGVAPAEVQYVETHGTGTPLGDPIEARALGAVLRVNRPPDRPCRIGSVKTNIGHLEGAAGIAGVIKTVLAMAHGELPPSLHFATPNPNIPFAELRLEVQSRRTPWETGGKPRLAGVSGFGFGGTNCHVVLEGPPPAEYLVALAANSPAELYALAQRTEAALREGAPLETVAGHAAGPGAHRLAVVARSAPEAREALAQHVAGGSHPLLDRGAGVHPPQVVFVCSGQGSQWSGMGCETLRREPAFRAKVEACDEVMRPLTGWSVLDQLTAARSRSRLHEVDVIQPLLFVIQVAQAELWSSWGITPSVVVGHSMGEVSAAHIAGILSLEDAARVICARSRLVRERASGTGRMAVVELPADELRELTGANDAVAVAAHNGPGATVVGGDPEAIRELMARLGERGISCHLVDVDYASHTPHMDRLLAPIAEELAGLRGRPAQTPMLSTVTSSFLDGAACDASYWAANLRRPVQFWPAIAELVARGHDTFVELGGHPILARPMMAGFARLGAGAQVIPTFRRDEESRALLEGLAALHVRGAPVAIAPPGEERAQLFTLSGRDAAALRAQAGRALAHVERSRASLADLCYTSNVRREHLDARLAIAARGVAELRARLSAFVEEGAGDRGRTPPHRRPRMAFVFSGQGGQWHAMGRELVRDEPVFAGALDACDAALRALGTASVREELARDAATSRVDDVAVTVPTLFALQVALAALWRSWGIVPDAVVGHSMGEVAAAHVAGALTLEDAARVIHHRGQLLARARGKGAMAVVELPRAEAEQAIAGERGRLAVAGSNGPRTTVLSGAREPLARVLAALDGRGIFQRLLHVDVPFHSPELDPLRAELVARLTGLAPAAAAIPVYSSVTANACPGEALDAVYWGRNLREPFLFAETIARMAEAGHALFVEIGPHPILAGAIRDVEPTALALPSLRRGEDERGVMLEALAALYERGFSPAWRRLHRAGGRLVSLPTYGWQEERFWLDRPALATAPSGSLALEIAPPPAGAADAATHVEELVLAVETAPYLADHVVQGELMVAGTAQLELAFRAARATIGRDVAIADVTFENGLFLPLGSRRIVQVAVVRSPHRGHVFQISSRATDGEPGWTRHSHGRIETAAPITDDGDQPLPVEEIQARLERLDGASHYARLVAHGLRHGPTFRGIEELWCGAGEALARISRPAELDGEPTPVGFHPALLEANLQALLGAVAPEYLEPAAGETFVFAGLGRLRLFRPLPDRLWAHVRLSPESDPEGDVLRADVRVHDATGQLAADLEGVVFRRVAGRDAGAQRPSTWQYELAWRPRELPDATPAELEGTWILLADRGGVAAELGRAIEEAGGRATVATDLDSLRRLLDDLPVAASGIVDLLGLDLDEAASAPAIELACSTLVELVKELSARPLAPRLWVVTRGAHEGACGQAALWGIGRVVEAEHPELWGGLVDLDDGVAALCRELAAGDDTQVAFRSGARLVPRWTRAEPAEAGAFACRAEGTYLVTGGLGGLGLEVARWLVEHGARRLVLVGRSAIPDRARWADAPAPWISAVRALERRGASVTVARADVADREQMRALLDGLGATQPPLRGIVHAAGVISPRLIADLDPGVVADVLRAKVAGTLVLDELTAGLALDFLVLFSSFESLVGARGQAPYAAANAFLDAFAERRRRAGRPALAVRWGRWGRVGLAADARERQLLSAEGVLELAPEKALEQLGALLASDRSGRVVAAIDWSRFRAAFGATAAQERCFEEIEDGASDAGPSEDGIVELLSGAAPAERASLLAGYLRTLVARALHCSDERIDLERPLGSLGLDSILAAEVRNRIQLEMGVTVPMLALLRGNTVGIAGEVLQAVELNP